MKTHIFRLHNGRDLRAEIEQFAKKKNIQAGVVITCVGNLKKSVIRMANAKVIKTFEGSFEIVSLVGTFESGNCHLHISISDGEGNVFGGHLKIGSIVGVTAELVLGELEGSKLSRKFDRATGYEELEVE